MAEALAILGGTAAAAQILHYGLALMSRTSALSHRARNTSDRIHAWSNESSAILTLLDNLRGCNIRFDANIFRLLQQCRSDIDEVRLLLRPFRFRAYSRRPSRRKEIFFVLCKEEEIEQRMKSCRRVLKTVSQCFLISPRKHDHNSRGIGNSESRHPVTIPMCIHNPDDLHTIAGRSNMGIALFYEGHLQEAEHIHRYVYSERQRILGNGHHETIKSRANIAMTINEMGHYAQAETLYRGALTLFQLIIGPTHPDTIKTYTNLATNLHDQGRYEDADDVVTTILPTMQSIQGEEAHGNYIEALEFHSILLHWMQMYAIALDVAGQVYEQRLISVGYAHYDTQRALSHVRDLAENCEEEQSTEAFGPCILAITT